MCGHVTLQLGPLGEGFGTQQTGEGLLCVLMSILDVLLQRSQSLVPALAVRTGEQLGEVVCGAGRQVCEER